MTHGALLNSCRLILSNEFGILNWPNNTGALKDQTGRLVRYGCSGSHDILGVIPWLGGRALGVEIKVGRDRVRENQKNFHAAFERAGGLSLVVHSEDDLRGAIELARFTAGDLPQPQLSLIPGGRG